FFFSSRRRHTRFSRDWSSDVCSSDLKRAILQDMCIVLHPYAPHITEELWALLGNPEGTLSYATYPAFNPEYLVEEEFAYPISIKIGRASCRERAETVVVHGAREERDK